MESTAFPRNTSSVREESKKDDTASLSDRSQGRVENGEKPKGLLLNKDEALAHARNNPSDATPIWVTFAENDKANPRNFPKWKKWYITCLVCWLNVLTTLCAGGYSSAAKDISQAFHVSSEVVTLGLSMYILGEGYALGPLLLAPMSEYFGRSPIYIGSWFLLVIFQIPLALAPNIGTVIVCRLIQGFGGSAPLTNTGGTVSDLWKRNESGYAMMIYGISSTFGPPMALVMSGYVVQNVGWHFLFWFFMIVTGAFWILVVLTLPETRHSIILEREAKSVQKILAKEGLKNATVLEHISDAHNQGEKRSLHRLFAINLTRPIKFLLTEPITMGAAAYNGLIYGIVYIFNESFPLVFGPGGHDFNVGEQGLSFLGLAIGVLVAACTHPIQERYYLKRVAENGGKGVPEARMWQSLGGAFLLPIGLFWFAWTSYPSVHWIVPIIGSGFFGAGIYVVILGILSYVIDSYQTYSASALAGVILVRNTVGAGFPLFAEQMYKKLGYEWATSLLAFLSLLFVPIPIWWFFQGEKLRLKSPWAREHFAQDEDDPH